VKKLKLGIPKGSLQEATIALFKRSGWTINVNSRSYFPEINDPFIECAICRAQEMSRYVENGTLDAGLTGKDWIAENSSDVHVVADLVYSKVSARPARWVLGGPLRFAHQPLEDLRARRSQPSWWPSPAATLPSAKSTSRSSSPGGRPRPRSSPGWPMRSWRSPKPRARSRPTGCASSTS
jgi:hypothetical protein